MLVLSRKIDERIVISTNAGDIFVTLVDIRGTRVQMGFDAPHGVKVLREEIHRKIQKQKEHR